MPPTLPEVWLRGPVPGIPALLQPVAHSLLQCREEIGALLRDAAAEQLLAAPAGGASVAWHVRHAAGSLDRLFTYARNETLSADQRAALAAEGQVDLAPNLSARLLAAFEQAVDAALAQLARTDEAALREFRGVGRAQLPSTVLGLLFHAAEHTQRHAGQAATTSKIVRAAG